MFKRYMEYKETKEFNKEMKRIRKHQERKQKLRILIISSGVMVAMFAALLGIELATPPEAAKSDSTVSVETQQETPQAEQELEAIQAEQQATSEIEKFAYIITKPLEDLTSEEIDFMGTKAGDPCYEKNALLPEEEMVSAIAECEGLK